MQALKLPAASGFAWIKAGFALYRRNPFALAANVMLMWLVLMLAGTVLVPVIAAVLPESLAPWIAQAPVALLLPALSVGVFDVCRLVDRGDPVHPFALFSGLKRNPRQLLILGLIYYVGSALALGVTTLIDGGLLIDVMQGRKKLDDSTLDAGNLLRSALLLIVLTLPALMANWFAPLLSGWSQVPAVKAAFFSFVAFWRNFGAFMAFGLGMMVVFWLLPGIAAAIATMASPTLGATLAMMLPLFMVPALYAAFYANALDVFPGLRDAAL